MSVCEGALWHLVTCIYIRTCNSSPAGAQDADVRNFRIIRQVYTNITFSWDIINGYHSSSYIRGFTFYYRQRNNPYESVSFASPSYDETTKANGGRTFFYTLSLEDRPLYGPYIMWIRVNRYRISPTYTYSEQAPIMIGI